MGGTDRWVGQTGGWVGPTRDRLGGQGLGKVDKRWVGQKRLGVADRGWAGHMGARWSGRRVGVAGSWTDNMRNNSSHLQTAYCPVVRNILASLH